MKLTLHNPVIKQFGMVPRALWQSKLTKNAKLQLACLLCQMDGTHVSVRAIDAMCGMGRNAGQAARKELEEAGLLRYSVLAFDHGMARGKSITIEIDPLLRGELVTTPENRGIRKPGITMPENRADLEKQKGPSPSDAHHEREGRGRVIE